MHRIVQTGIPLHRRLYEIFTLQQLCENMFVYLPNYKLLYLGQNTQFNLEIITF